MTIRWEASPIIRKNAADGSNNGIDIGVSDGECVGIVYLAENGDITETRRRARMVASAPELLDALKGLQVLIQLVCIRDDVPSDLMDIVKSNHRWTNAERVIAKTNGGVA